MRDAPRHTQHLPRQSRRQSWPIRTIQHVPNQAPVRARPTPDRCPCLCAPSAPALPRRVRAHHAHLPWRTRSPCNRTPVARALNVHCSPCMRTTVGRAAGCWAGSAPGRPYRPRTPPSSVSRATWLTPGSESVGGGRGCIYFIIGCRRKNTWGPARLDEKSLSALRARAKIELCGHEP
jgi:hypothetical protein